MTSSPIAQVVAPLKDRAVEYAIAKRREFLEGSIAANPVGTNLTTKFPYPRGTAMGKAQYRQMAEAYHFTRRLFTTRVEGIGHPGDPLIVTGVNVKNLADLLNATRAATAASFDAYVTKLESKVGECQSASVMGDLWARSVLTVTKDDAVEHWSTQMIVNVSGLGNPYNQWPTRKIGGKLAKAA